MGGTVSGSLNIRYFCIRVLTDSHLRETGKRGIHFISPGMKNKPGYKQVPDAAPGGYSRNDALARDHFEMLLVAGK